MAAMMVTTATSYRGRSSKVMITALLLMFMLLMVSAVPDRAGKVIKLEESCMSDCVSNFCPIYGASYAECSSLCAIRCASQCTIDIGLCRLKAILEILSFHGHS
ncbi:unnamed protein product [Ilex paraguariensis]|uniref:Uncharacterized protein n=1 Tax=Ilex paraguariensis TaxID=185542 RepID=A0ABC8SN28_9AQUA